jgi:hypothetical protein
MDEGKAMTSMKWTPERYTAYLKERNRIVNVQLEELPPKPSKMHNIFEECDGIKFRSKKEAARYRELAVLKNLKECWFLRQVPFYLPGNTKYVLDFLIFWKDGKVTLEDAKGMRTAAFIKAKKQVEALYPVRIEEA